MRQPGGAAAAGQAQLGNIFGKFRENSPDFGDIGRLDIEARSAEKRAAMMADAEVEQSRITAEAQLKAMEAQADAAEGAASSSGWGKAIGAVASIGGALLSDKSTKNNIEDIEGALATLRGLKPVSFYYNEE